MPEQVMQRLVSGKAGSVPWRVACTKCGDNCRGTQHWVRLARTVCRAGLHPDLDLHWEERTHELVAVPGGYQCKRCHLPVVARRKGKAEVARCPAWSLVNADGGTMAGAELASAELAGLPTEWKSRRGACVRRAPFAKLPVKRPAESRPEVVRGPRKLGPFRGHVFVSAVGLTCCIACGLRKVGGRKLEHRPCNREGAMTTVVRRAFESGRFDADICRVGPVAVSYAEVRGRQVDWRPREPD